MSVPSVPYMRYLTFQVSAAMMISDGVRVPALVALPAPTRQRLVIKLHLINVNETPVGLEHARECLSARSRVHVAKLDLPMPTHTTSVTHALGPPIPGTPVVLHALSYVL